MKAMCETPHPLTLSWAPGGASIPACLPRLHFTGASSAKDAGSHRCLPGHLTVSPVEFAVAVPFAFLLSAPPRLFINCVTGHVIGGGPVSRCESTESSQPTESQSAYTYSKILVKELTGKRKQLTNSRVRYKIPKRWAVRRTDCCNLTGGAGSHLGLGCEAVRHYRCTGVCRRHGE